MHKLTRPPHTTTQTLLLAAATVVVGCNDPTTQSVETTSATGDGEDGSLTSSTGASETGTTSGSTESTAGDFGNAEDSSGGTEMVVLFDVYEHACDGESLRQAVVGGGPPVGLECGVPGDYGTIIRHETLDLEAGPTLDRVVEFRGGIESMARVTIDTVEPLPTALAGDVHLLADVLCRGSGAVRLVLRQPGITEMNMIESLTMCSDFSIPEPSEARLSIVDDSVVGVGVDFLGGDTESRTVIFANPRIVQGPLEAD